jgi:hypothetical protein
VIYYLRKPTFGFAPFLVRIQLACGGLKIPHACCSGKQYPFSQNGTVFHLKKFAKLNLIVKNLLKLKNYKNNNN